MRTSDPLNKTFILVQATARRELRVHREAVIRAGLVDVGQAVRSVSGSHPFTLVLAVIPGSSEMLPNEAAPEKEPRTVIR